MTDLNVELLEIKRRAETQNKLIADLIKNPDLKNIQKKEPQFSTGLVVPIAFTALFCLQLCCNYKRSFYYSCKVHVTIYLLIFNNLLYYTIKYAILLVMISFIFNFLF